MRGVSEYLVGWDLLLRWDAAELELGAHVEDEQLDRLCREKEVELKQHELRDLKDDLDFWALLSYRKSVAGR